MSPAKIQSLMQEAIVHHRSGRLVEAGRIYARVRTAAPRNFDALQLSGLVAYQQGRIREAVELLGRAHEQQPSSAPCAMRYGLALLAAARTAEAEAVLRQVVKVKPDFAEGWDNLAYCLKTQDRLAEAVACHERAVALNPKLASAWYNFGLTLSLCGRSTEALACHDRAIAADPTYWKARFGRAQALQQLHRVGEAIQDYGAFLMREPAHHEARSYRLFALQYLDTLTREQIFAEHVAYGKAVAGPSTRPAFPNTPEPGRRLRVAILSPDLRAHSCAFFLEPLLRHLDRTKFELYLYHDHFREDAVSQRLRPLAAVWRNFIGQQPATVEQTIRADAPDILVDLAGHTGMTNRLPLFARHLAPVQVTYLGYPDTTGLPAIGYRLTDALADPEGEADALAVERLVRFSPCAWTYAPPPEAPEPVERPAGAPVTFGSFNNLSKISDSTLRLWAGVLARVPGSRLLLKCGGLGDATVRARWSERATACGLPLERVELVERTAGVAEHLALYSRVDVALDTFPYHGTTTTCEALWMGVPVVTQRGDRHVARVGASLLTAAGHPEWIADSAEDYVRIAAELAQDGAGRARLRRGLRDALRAGPLLDHAGQAQRFGVALRDCWREWCASTGGAGRTADESAAA